MRRFVAWGGLIHIAHPHNMNVLSTIFVSLPPPSDQNHTRSLFLGHTPEFLATMKLVFVLSLIAAGVTALPVAWAPQGIGACFLAFCLLRFDVTN